MLDRIPGFWHCKRKLGSKKGGCGEIKNGFLPNKIKTTNVVLPFKMKDSTCFWKIKSSEQFDYEGVNFAFFL